MEKDRFAGQFLFNSFFDESKIVDGNFTVVLPLDKGFNGQFKFSRIHTVNWLHCSNHELTVKIIDK